MAKYQGGKLSDGTPLNVAVYKAYRNAGLSHNQAMGITAEVGRENSFRADIAFGNHTDPAPSKTGKPIRNLGFLSWNQGRDKMLEGYLKKRGVMKNGVMQKTQANLNAQAEFSVREMKSKKYAPKLKNFWANPNASPESFAQELGQNYIVWAYGQNTIRGKVPGTRQPFNWKAEDSRRRSYLPTLGAMLGDKTNYSQGSQPQQAQPLGNNWSAFKSKLEGNDVQAEPQPLGTDWSAFKSSLEGEQVAIEPEPLGTDWDAFKSNLSAEQDNIELQPLGNDWNTFKATLEPQQAATEIQPLGNDWDVFKQQLEPQEPVLQDDEQQNNIIGGNYGSRI